MLAPGKTEGDMSVGAQLRSSREARGLSIDAVAHMTRVQPRILAAIERDDVRAVPPRPFGRGFVKAYAREIGLDAEKTTRDYFAQFAPIAQPPGRETELPERSSSPRTREWSSVFTHGWSFAVVSLGVLAVITLAFVIGRPGATTGARPAPAPVVGTSGNPAAGDTASAGAGSTDGAPPASSAPAANLTVILTASRPSWVSARADGRRALYLTVTPGSPQTLAATREIVIRVGDAGALAWRINGREAGAMGRSGQVRDVRVTPATAATIH
jgi:cytoskeleton protein RodZ